MKTKSVEYDFVLASFVCHCGHAWESQEETEGLNFEFYWDYCEYCHPNGDVCITSYKHKPFINGSEQ